MAAFVAPRAAAPATSFTQAVQNDVQTFTDVVPCLGPADITITFNWVFHQTTLPSGAIHFTVTQAGTFVALSPGTTDPLGSGHFAFWAGANANKNNAAFTFTLNVAGTTAGGERFTGHILQHASLSATGISLTFFHLVCS